MKLVLRREENVFFPSNVLYHGGGGQSLKKVWYHIWTLPYIEIYVIDLCYIEDKLIEK